MCLRCVGTWLISWLLSAWIYTQLSWCVVFVAFPMHVDHKLWLYRDKCLTKWNQSFQWHQIGNGGNVCRAFFSPNSFKISNSLCSFTFYLLHNNWRECGEETIWGAITEVNSMERNHSSLCRLHPRALPSGSVTTTTHTSIMYVCMYVCSFLHVCVHIIFCAINPSSLTSL